MRILDQGERYVLPFNGTVERVIATNFLMRCKSPSNVDDWHVRVTLPRVPSLERSLDDND